MESTLLVSIITLSCSNTLPLDVFFASGCCDSLSALFLLSLTRAFHEDLLE